MKMMMTMMIEAIMSNILDLAWSFNSVEFKFNHQVKVGQK